MKRRAIGIVLAVLLAGGGTAALVGYVQAAKDKAVSSEVLTTVYVVDAKIPKGAKATDIRAKVKAEQVPARLKLDDAVTDLASVEGKVAAVELLPGEQLVAARLTEGSVSNAPKGLMQISVMLEAQRAVGGQLVAGDLVGVFLSFDPFDTNDVGLAALYENPPTTPAPVPGSTTPTSAAKSPNMTHLEFQKIQVTAVQRVVLGGGLGGKNDSKATGEDAPDIDTERWVVTLAMTAKQAEQLVFAAEFGHVWLANQPATVDESGTRIVTLGNVYTVKIR